MEDIKERQSLGYELCPKSLPPLRVSNLKEEPEVRIDLLAEDKEVVKNFQHQKREWKVPWFIITMCIIQFSMYFCANRHVRDQLMFVPEYVSDVWRFFTYMLLHSDMLHLMMNISLQFIIGFCLESEQSHWKVAAIYIIGGISGSMATLYLQPQLSLMGASAGVYAMLMSHIPHLFKNFRTLPQRYLRIAVLVILFLSDVCFTTFHVLINHNTNPRICLEAHAAGAVAGLALGFLIYSSTVGKGAAQKGWHAAQLVEQC